MRQLLRRERQNSPASVVERGGGETGRDAKGYPAKKKGATRQGEFPRSSTNSVEKASKPKRKKMGLVSGSRSQKKQKGGKEEARKHELAKIPKGYNPAWRGKREGWCNYRADRSA